MVSCRVGWTPPSRRAGLRDLIGAAPVSIAPCGGGWPPLRLSRRELCTWAAARNKDTNALPVATSDSNSASVPGAKKAVMNISARQYEGRTNRAVVRSHVRVSGKIGLCRHGT